MATSPTADAPRDLASLTPSAIDAHRPWPTGS